MRMLRLVAGLSVLALIAVASSPASQGAVVSRGTASFLSYWWNDYTVTHIAVLSADPQFYLDGVCNNTCPLGPAPDWRLLRTHDVYQLATGKDNGWLKGPQFVRVYRLPEAVDALSFSLIWPDDICHLLKGEVLSTGGPYPLVAQGITEFVISGQNNCAWGPGQNTWEQKAVGTLTTEPGVCGDGVGMAKFDFTFHYMLTKDAVVDPFTCAVDDPAHIRKVVIRGPDLKCIGK